MLDLEVVAELLPLPREEGRTVVGHYPFDANVLLSEPRYGADQEGAGGLAALVRQDVDVGESREVVGGHVDELKPLFR